MKNNLSVIFMVLAVNIILPGQDFKLDKTKDLVIGTSALLLLGSSFLVEGDPGFQQPRENINPFDSLQMKPYNSTVDKIGTIGTCISLVSPGVLMFFSGPDISTLGTYGVMYSEAFFITMGVKNLMKDLIPRWRPYSYFELNTKEDDDYFNSFPSGHTAFAFMSASFLSTILLTEYGDNRWSRPISAAAFAVAGTIAYLRVQSGEHFLTDVLTGSVLGSLIGWLIPFLHKDNSGSAIPLEPMVNARGVSFKISF